MGIISKINNGEVFDDEAIFTDRALEAEIILTALRDECSSDEEFATLIGSTAVEMALYDVIENAEIATEAVKRIVIEDFKQANFNRITKRRCIQMAKNAKNTNYDKYRLHRDKMIEYRDKIYKQYEAKAKVEARRIINNAKNKSSSMGTAGGKDITSKIDAQIKKLNG